MSGTIQPLSTWCLSDLPSHLFLARAGNQDSRGKQQQLLSFTVTCGNSDDIFKRKAFTSAYNLTIWLQ